MAIDARIEVLQQVLQDLHERIQGLEEIAVIQGDGKFLARLYQTETTQETFLMMTEFVKLTDEISLALIGKSTINFGLLNSGCRVAIEKIQEVVTGNESK